jgi:hypothetical protein
VWLSYTLESDKWSAADGEVMQCEAINSALVSPFHDRRVSALRPVGPKSARGYAHFPVLHFVERELYFARGKYVRVSVVVLVVPFFGGGGELGMPSVFLKISYHLRFTGGSGSVTGTALGTTVCGKA